MSTKEITKLSGEMQITDRGVITITLHSTPGIICPRCKKKSAYKRKDGSIKCYQCDYIGVPDLIDVPAPGAAL